MKILVITSVGDFRGGAEKSLFETMKTLVDSDNQLTLITSNTGDLTNESMKLGIETVTINIEERLIFITKKNIFRSIISALYINYRILNVIKKNHIDILYVHTSAILPWVFIDIFIQNLHKIIVQERSGEPDILIRWLYRLLGKRLTVVFNSKFMKNKYYSIFRTVPWKNDYVLYPPIDFGNLYPISNVEKSKVKSQFGLETTDYLIVYAGRICRSKQIHHIIEAMDLISESKRIHLAIVGKASNDDDIEYEKFLLQRADCYIHNKKVQFVGFKKNISSILSAADLLILPSKDEPFGRIIIESQASGTPVIVANSGGAPEAMDHSFGFLFETGNVPDLAKKICDMYDNQLFYEKTSLEKIRENLKNKVGVQQHKKEVIKIINQIESGTY